MFCSYFLDALLPSICQQNNLKKYCCVDKKYVYIRFSPKLTIIGENMENEDINKAIAYLADKVSKYHERLLAVERDIKRHIKNTEQHCCDDCDCKKPK
jgi:hypothetical protein